MPHVNDKIVRHAAADGLGIPLRVVRAMTGGGRLRLDALPAGQREFNGLLFRCLSTPRELNPWDWSVGRSFFDLQSYTIWAAGTASGFVLSANAPARVAAYLLPHRREASDPHNRIGGIPGLRLLSAAGDRIALHHLPTGGRIELTESLPPGASNARIARHLNVELDTVRSRASQPLFQAPAMTDDETAAYEGFHHHSELLAALAARIGLWWTQGTYMTLRSDRRNSTLGTLSWRIAETGHNIEQRLTRDPLGIPEATIAPGISPDTNSYLCLGHESLEIDGRIEPRKPTAKLFRR